ncbi:class I SAM-dependent methyltransferase [Desertivirga brevis]|uniref:class I SAM-dependent methyltransferase n=1 Tax=Desertivirga brevis TaxID=2810310 RepID=UPI001A957371|nr:class I SAM-dependent methyltransferase [Pedobacter sp. SYSU D00873]
MEKERSKSTVDEIRERFDHDVERFSNLGTGQQTTIDAPLSLELITEAASMVNPEAENLLDIGCGAGNYTLKMLEKLPILNCTLIDLSIPMLDKAKQRVADKTDCPVNTIQGDIREVQLETSRYDIVLAGAVLHHLREVEEWEQVFSKIYKALKPGGSFWVSDLVVHDCKAITELFWKRYGNYLKELGGNDFQQKVFDYIDKEDSPRSLTFQLEMMKNVGFRYVEILHKNGSFATFGAIK